MSFRNGVMMTLSLRSVASSLPSGIPHNKKICMRYVPAARYTIITEFAYYHLRGCLNQMTYQLTCSMTTYVLGQTVLILADSA